jgi:hypothetical protein
MTPADGHNLDITMYSFQDLLNLFGIKSKIISTEEIKSAKRKVLMMHPDKSGLDANYFLFYKRALDIIYHYYLETNKQNQSMSEENTEYKNKVQFNENLETVVKKNVGEMSSDKFQSWFNEQFEEVAGNRFDPTRNDWFRNEDPVYKLNENVKVNGISSEFEKIKKQNAELAVYRGVQEMRHNAGSSLYDEEDTGDQYISTDPFSKLKFDDLRKVHKDQTILAVGEHDFSKVKTYKNMEQLQQERGTQVLDPLDKSEAEKLFQDNEKTYKERILKQQFESNRKTDQFEEKNKTILSSFLRLF